MVEIAQVQIGEDICSSSSSDESTIEIVDEPNHDDFKFDLEQFTKSE